MAFSSSRISLLFLSCLALFWGIQGREFTVFSKVNSRKDNTTTVEKTVPTLKDLQNVGYGLFGTAPPPPPHSDADELAELEKELDQMDQDEDEDKDSNTYEAFASSTISGMSDTRDEKNKKFYGPNAFRDGETGTYKTYDSMDEYEEEIKREQQSKYYAQYSNQNP